MTRDDVISMAMKAGFGTAAKWEEFYPPFERFANLVAAAEREACALIVEDTEVEQFTHCQVLHDDGCATLAAAAKEIRARGNK